MLLLLLLIDLFGEQKRLFYGDQPFQTTLFGLLSRSPLTDSENIALPLEISCIKVQIDVLAAFQFQTGKTII